jgi:CRP-like cAMP-binding protein
MVAAGTWLYAEGDPIASIGFLKRGTVVLSREASDRGGRRVAWALRRPGALLGAEGLVRPAYLDSARALTEVVHCSAPRSELTAWVDGSGTAARALLDLVLLGPALDAPRRASSEGSAVERVAQWLLDEGPASAEGVPRKVIAELLGMLPETLSRALAALTACGAIVSTRRSIRVLDAELLRAAGRGSG